MPAAAAAARAGPPVLEAASLVRDYGPVRAVNHVSFRLGAGEFLSVFGPNGAGKTSLLRLLAGGLRPTSGEVRVSGTPLTVGDRAARARIGILSHLSFLYGRLTAQENLRFYGRLHGLGDLDSRVPDRLADVGLERYADSPVDTLSRGTVQRLAVARALLHDPEIVLLDEPYTGLDAYAGAMLQELLSALKDGGRTVVMVTHNLGRGLELADRVAIQVRGSFVFEAERTDLDAAGLERSYRRAVEGRA
ncbi:MAG: heme ABC exporter ATP-binding protein CcmA [Gammaproteobacteria bacterium]|nr:heme ABC exporter ATP-binding protein CcmA [Gammaproteobacteria bacterium]MYF60338.1 heme ABC exporter ATP-binding protein CcmA [Gammaproteobacteria bacterium]MYI22592.1 heme ABC exporter ATP-binding protein CcmA [Gammaproteobacteria bacterium]